MAAATALPTPPTVAAHPAYLAEKWKLSKKESSSTRTRAAAAAISIKAPPHRRCAFTRKCAALVKEQRARFYIMRRCVTMLICWREYSDA